MTLQVSAFQVEPCCVGFLIAFLTLFEFKRYAGRENSGIEKTSSARMTSASWSSLLRAAGSAVNCAFFSSADAFGLQESP